MKFKLIYLFLFLFFHGTTHACELVSYAYIIKIDNILNDQIIKSSSCSEQTQEKFIQFINTASGVINNKIIKNYLNEKNLNISPQMIKVEPMEDYLASIYEKDPLIFRNIRYLLGSASLNLNKNQKPQIECRDCEKLGRKNIKFLINSKEVWLSAEVGKTFKVLQATRAISPMESILNQSDFEFSNKVLFKSSYDFTNYEQIKFYRLNKNLKKGEILKVHHLSPKQLIQYGQKVQVSLNSSHIKLKTTAKAKKSGKFGDFIELQNQKSNKVFLGKIIDYNKVEVEL